jgi:hypothetical protein
VANGVFDWIVHGRKVLGLCWWQHLHRFLTLSDYRLNLAVEQRRNLMWKVQSLLDELNHCARKHWIPGRWVAIDEQTIGFKGRSGMKLKISYKREGGGFQCDALCDEGYTFSFFFVMAMHQRLAASMTTLSCPIQQNVSPDLSNGCQMCGLASTWTTFITHRIFTLHYTLPSV